MRLYSLIIIYSFLLGLLGQGLSAETPVANGQCSLVADYNGLFGVRVGSEFGAKHFRSYEAFISVETPLRKGLGEDWLMRLDVESALGALNRRGEYGVIFHVGPVLALEPVAANWGFRFGFAPTFISRDTFGPVDLGGKLQLSSSFSAYWQCNDKYRLLYRFQHTSNGGIRPSNPGLDLHSLGLALRF